MNKDELKKRTKAFAHKCVKIVKYLPNTYLGRHVKGQLIRCSTSVAANYRAACRSQSKASFIAKLSIVIEESDESYFWIEFIIDEKLILNQEILELLSEADQLTAIFVSSRKTARKNLS